MELKAFKGMPHEFGGIDYTEGSEVEGGEFAVQIGKSGNEYIFDKNSSEGERLSKEYKRLDKNGRLTEDDPLALEAFDQMAREEALKHAQRSVNEKGIDPFRNMYDQEGQAANGGVKYAAGGAKDMYFTGGGMGSIGGGMSGGATGGMGNFGSIMGGIGGGLNMIGDLFKTPDIDFDAMFKGISAGENPNLVNPQRYMNLVSDDSTDMTALKQSMQGERGGQTTQSPMDFAAMFKSEEAQQDVAEAQQQIDAVPNAISGASGIGGMIGGLVRGDSKAGQLKEPVSFRNPGDERSRSQGPEFHKMEGKDYAASHLEGAASGAMTGLQVAGPWGALGGAILGGVINPIKDKIQEDKIQKEATEAFNRKLKEAGEEEIRQSMMNAIAMDVDGTALIDKDRYAGVMRNGGAKPIYGYYQNGGGKKKERSYDGMKDPVQWDVMQNYIASNDTRNRMSQAAVGSGDEMYAPYRVDNTCVAGVNCFEDLAGIPSSEGIPDDIYNNDMLRDFFESKEGKKFFRKAKNEKPGDYVQFEKLISDKGFNDPYHVGMVTGDNIYLGDGSRTNPLYYSSIYKEPSIETSNLANLGINFEYNNINPNFYRMRNKKNRQKVIDAAVQAKQQGKDVVRPTFGDEEPLYLPMQQYRKNTPYPIAGF